MVTAPPLTRALAHQRVYSGEFGAHVHGHAQVLIGLSGQMELGWGTHGLRVDASNGAVIPAGLAHDYGTRDRADVWVIDAPMQHGLERARRITVPAGWQARLASQGVQALLDELAGRGRARPRRALDLAALARHIDSDLTRRWSVRDLARWAALSPQHLHERMLQDAQCSPMQFVRSRRLSAARTLRDARRLSLREVSERVGYSSASALAFALRRQSMQP